MGLAERGMCTIMDGLGMGSGSVWTPQREVAARE